MDVTRFDTIARRFAARRLSRRQAVAQGGTGLVAGALAATGLSTAHAQDATPAPEGEKTQSFQSGSITPKEGEDGTYTLTLDHDLGQTIYFSDRPERIVGAAPTQAFLDGLGFAPDNPPNAALVATPEGSEEQEVLVIELLTPGYDADAGTLVYEANVLADYAEPGLGHLARQQTDYELPESFGAGSLFIDDCPNSLLDGCYSVENGDWHGTWNFMGYISSGNCWNSSTWLCEPCWSYSYVCNETYPQCENACKDDIQLCGSPFCGPD